MVEFAVIYDLDGNKVQETFSYINENEEPIEVISYFYENGNLKLKTESKFGHLNGLVESYHENGQIMRAEYYELGDLKEGKCFDARGNKIACDSFAQLPEFPGGEQALDAYIAKFENYLLAPVKKENKFVLNFSFDVNPDGTVTYPTIYDNSNKEVEKRLVKIMSMMPKWNPATLEDQPIRKTVCFTMGWELMAKN